MISNFDDVTSRIDALVEEVFGYPVCSTTPCARGVASLNFLVRTTAEIELIARCDFRRSSSEFAIDAAFQSSAQRSGVSVPDPITYATDWPECSVSLRRAIRGRTIGERNVVGSMILRSAGEQLARIHQSKPPAMERPWFYSSIICESEIWNEMCSDARHASHRSTERMVALALELWTEHIRAVREHFDASHVVHGDFKPDNVLVTGSARLTILDWEKAAISDPVFDLAFAVFHFLCRKPNHPLDASATRQLLSGYAKVRPLNRLQESTFAAFVVVTACTFFIVDAAQQVRNARLPKRLQNYRRTEYFCSYCLPVFETFTAQIGDIIAWCSDCKRSGVLRGEA